jgi:hypothetical protein
VDELLQRLQAIGLDPAKAREVVGTVRAFLEEKLPGPVANQLDSFLTGAPETMQSFLGKLPLDQLSLDQLPLDKLSLDKLPGDLGAMVQGLLGGAGGRGQGGQGGQSPT